MNRENLAAFTKGADESRDEEIQGMTFKSTREDRLAGEASDEFHTIMKASSEDILIDTLHKWCEHYYGHDHLPINYAVNLWKKVGNDEKIKPFVVDEFATHKDVLEDHFLDKEQADEIRTWLNL